MWKKILLTLLILVVLIGGLAAIKKSQFDAMGEAAKNFAPPPAIVTTAEVTQEIWQPALTAVGSLEAVQGVTLTAELAGRITNISFESGQEVNVGDVLIEQDTSTEQAQLKSAEAQARLARTTEKRTRTLLQKRMVSQAEYDTAAATQQGAEAEVDRLRAQIAKKKLRAPFTGTLGLRAVNLGQTLQGGEPIVSLQSLDPIYVNFRLPQQRLNQVDLGQTITITTDALPGESLKGTLTTITPEVDSATRNLRLQATLPNPDRRLRPGMFAQVRLPLPQNEPSLILPSTAILYAPYGDSVFRLKPGAETADGKPSQILEQAFVRLGRTRGDFVEVLNGVNLGEQVVSTGVFKLRNGQNAVVDNRLNPAFQTDPTPEDQ